MAVISQLVKLNPDVGDIHNVQTGPEGHPASYEIGRGYSQVLMWLKHGIDHPPLLVLRLTKEQRSTYTVPLGIHGLFWGKL